MAQRISEQVAEYLTLGGDGFPSQTSVPLHVQGHTILGTTQTNNNDDNYKANLTTINGHLIINASYNNHNNYSQGIRINKGTNNRALLMLGGDTGSTYGTSDTTWYIGTFPNPNNSSITDLIIARNDCQFNNEKPSLQLTNDGLTVYKRVVVDSKTSGSANAGFYLKGGSSAGSDIYSQMYISSIGVAGNSSPGIAVLELGNNKSANTTNNAKGQLRLWGSGNKYSNIETKATANRTAYLPDVSGWLVMGGNGSSTGVGNSNTPVYIKTTGVADTVSNSVLTNLSSTTAGNIYTAEPRPGVTGTLAVTNGGTGNTSFTQYRLIYTSTATELSTATNLYTNGSNLAINKTSITNGFSFEVNGNSKFTGSLIPSSDSVFDLGDENTYWWNNVYANYFSGLSEATNKLITYVGRDVSIPTTANYGGAGAVFHIIGKTGENGNGSPVDMNILQMNWDNDGGYDSQLGIANGTTPQFLFRSQISNNNTNWRQAASIAQGTKTGSVTKPVYVDSSGEVKTIDVTISSGTTNNFTYYSSNKTLSSTSAIQYNATYGVIMEKAKIKALIPYYLCTDCLNTDTWFSNPSWHVLFNMTASNKPTEAGLYLTTLSVKYQKALIVGGNFSYTNCNVYWGGVLPIIPAEGSPYDDLFYQLTNSIDSQGSNNVQLGYYFHYTNSTYYGTVFNINFTDAAGDCQYKILEAKLTLQKITSLLI